MSKAAELAALIGSQTALSNRNLIINGAMNVAQRGTSVSGVGGSSGYFTCDRWRVSNTTDGRYTLEQSAVTDLDGISSALKFSCTTADTSVAAGDTIILSQRMEGFNTQSLKSSSTSMKSFTLSFYAKSNASRVITSDVLFTDGTNRLAAKAHTIGTSWQKYTMTVPAASNTQLDNDNTNNLQLNFWLHAGSDFTSGTLSTTLGPNVSANRAAGIGSLVASTSNTFEITGVQLEVGEQATPFEHRSFGDELARCQRYFQIVGDYRTIHSAARWSSTALFATYPIAVPLRAGSTQSTGGTFPVCRNYSNSQNGTATAIQSSIGTTLNFYNSEVMLVWTVPFTPTANHSYQVYADHSNDYVNLDAEL